MHIAQTTLVLLTVAISGALVPDASAATVERNEVSLSASRCQPALPAFDGAIRKRPLAMQNEGASGLAFVTCAFDGVAGDVPSRKELQVGLINTTPAVPGQLTLTSVSCTLVDAGAGFAAPIYITKSVLYGAAAHGPITFTTADNNGQPFIYPALSCGLPPGFGVEYVGSRFDVEIGS